MTKSVSRGPDLLHGPVFSNMTRFFLPIMLGSLLQQLYSMVDAVVLGRLVGKTALAAVGASSALTTIFICVAIGGGISKQPLLLESLRSAYDGLYASRAGQAYMEGLPRCQIVPCAFSSEANQVGVAAAYFEAMQKK